MKFVKEMIWRCERVVPNDTSGSRWSNFVFGSHLIQCQLKRAWTLCKFHLILCQIAKLICGLLVGPFGLYTLLSVFLLMFGIWTTLDLSSLFFHFHFFLSFFLSKLWMRRVFILTNVDCSRTLLGLVIS